VKHTLRQVPPLAWEGGPRLKNALSGGNLGLTEASIWRISAYTDRCKAGGAYDAARLMIEALKRADVKNRSDSKIADRDRVRVAFGAVDSPKSAVAGLTGRLYFNTNRDIPRPIRLLPLRPVRHGAAATRAHRSAQSSISLRNARKAMS
jgi:hypothetical protein